MRVILFAVLIFFSTSHLYAEWTIKNRGNLRKFINLNSTSKIARISIRSTLSVRNTIPIFLKFRNEAECIDLLSQFIQSSDDTHPMNDFCSGSRHLFLDIQPNQLAPIRVLFSTLDNFEPMDPEIRLSLWRQLVTQLDRPVSPEDVEPTD